MAVLASSPASPRRCEICSKSEVSLVEMEPGPDGQPWYLCQRDYFDGLFPGKLGRIPAQYRNYLEVTAVSKGEAVIPSTGEKVPWELKERRPADLPAKPTKPRKRKAG